MNKTVSFIIRDMTPEDLPAVSSIESKLFPVPWSFTTLERVLHGTGNLYYVAKKDGVIAGYFLAMQILDEAEIHRIAVKEDFQKMGAAKLLMEHFLAICNESGVTAVTLEVRSRNKPAVGLYESFGFVVEGRRKNYYHQPEDDALLMWRRI